MYHKSRTWMGLLLASVATFWAHAGQSAPPPARAGGVCAASSQQAREHVQAGRLRRAREAFALCAKSSCGGLAQQCRSGLQQLDSDIPSVIPVASDPTGAQRIDVRVSVDGELLTSRIDGRSWEVDPGEHEFSFSTEQGEVYSEKVLILQGQRNRVVAAKLKGAEGAPSSSVDAAKPVPPPAAGAATTPSPVEHAKPLAPAHTQSSAAEASRADTSRASPVLSYVVGGVGLAAIGGGFLLAHWGREDDILLDRCAPDCSQKSVDHVSHMYIAADISLGVGVVALGAATWLYLTRPEIEDTTSAQTYHFDVKPLASGAFATVGRSF
jgi:hypothetical protein